MQKLTKENLFWNRGDLSTLPKIPPLRVSRNESFLIETIDTEHRNILSKSDISKPQGPMAGNPWTGPVYVEGIKAGDVMSVFIEDIRVTDNCFIKINENSLLPPEFLKNQENFISISNGIAHFPGGINIPIRPMFGCFGVVPLQIYTDPWKHGGNMDIPDISAGNIIHLRCERDGAFWGCGDGHAIQGEGEINGFSLEVSLLGQIRIEKSKYRNLKTILIETPDKFITVGIGHDFKESVMDATYSMADLLSENKNISIQDAYQFVSHIGDTRLGAVWPAWCKKWHIPIPVCLHLRKEYFR
ncbi:MAG: acetamidase/formamidase family protein [bacterium]|nr:acetamidase/formamidase family protein [bacterium]